MSEKQFCPKCEYYFSEMFTCPICYGEQKATERIIKLLEADRNESHALDDLIDTFIFMDIGRTNFKQGLIALIKGENK